jgi:adenylylsulfate kinase
MASGAVLWFTGLPGAGKTTIANALHERLRSEGTATVLLDGDVLRHGLNAGLGFSPEERRENQRRVAHVAQLFKNEGFVAIVATIAPLREHRELARSIVNSGFAEVFVDTPVTVCEARDPKGHYKLARSGELPNFTGVGSAYEKPQSADVVIATQTLSVDACVQLLHDYLNKLAK